MMLDQSVQNHVCKKNEEEVKFRQTAKEKGYQQCTTCGATVELMEACNHIRCVQTSHLFKHKS
jgi:DNA-directed RNA polymerase subunit RPC12/RpoP